MSRILFLSFIIYSLIILALASVNGLLIIMVLPVLLYLGAGLLFGPENIELTVERELSQDRALPGTPVEVSISLTNLGERLENILLFDQLPHGLKLIDGDTSLMTSLDTGETARLQYSVQAKRGYYRFQHVIIEAADRLGIRQKNLTLDAEGRLFVQPVVKSVGRVNIRPRGTRVYAGYIPARKGGAGVEFFGVREYQQGDPLRWINWRASARHRNTLFINEFEQERVADVSIILDTRQRSEVKVNGGSSLFECSVQATAALAESFLNDGNRVGLLQYGTQLDWTIPGYGKVQRERILQSLARSAPGASMIFEKLENLPKRLLPSNSQLVFISPLHNDDVDILIQLRARGYALLVISPDPVSFELGEIDSHNETNALASRLARIERTLMLHKLRQAGIQVLDWDVNIPLDGALHVALSRPVPQVHPIEVRT